jgi:hypothetical protein
MTATLTPVIVLERSIELLSNESAWAKGTMATMANGIAVEPFYSTAKCFCIVGALERSAQGVMPIGEYPSTFHDDATFTEYADAEVAANQFVREAIHAKKGTYSIPGFNDAWETKHSDVLEILNDALALSRAAVA